MTVGTERKDILDSKKGSQRVGGGRGPELPEMEEQLWGLFLERRAQGFEVTDK